MTAQPPTFTLVVGPEELLVERAIDSLTQAALKVDPTAEVHTVDAADSGAAGLIAEACSPSLFGTPAVVIITHAESLDDAGLAQLEQAIANPPVDTWILAAHEGRVKGKKYQTALAKLADEQIDAAAIKKGRAVNDFVAAEVKRHRKKMDGQAQTLFVAAVGSDARTLSAGLAQLASDVEGDEITEADVTRYFGGATDVTSYQIADAVMARRGKEALHMLRMAESVAGPTLGPPTVSALVFAMRQLVAVATAPPGMSERDLAVEAKVPPWKIRTLKQQSRHWNQKQCAVAMLVLADLDAAMKGGLNIGDQLVPEQKALVLEQSVVKLSN
ncbi:MAG: DNA polymerase III subunit delta [Candidatus Nanopelagicales bacterium]